MLSALASAVRPTCVLAAVWLTAVAPAAAQTASVAELPRVFLDTTYVPPSGATIAVPANGNLQAALDAARPGDVIELQAGATFIGNFTLPDKPGTGWIHVQSSALALLTPPGTRVSPALAALMPRIVSPNASPALSAAANAHHYRFIGVEITGMLADTTTTHFGLVALDSGTDFVFDRCYIHGTPTGNYKRGIGLNSARTAVIDSYLADFHSTVQDAQAIAGWNGPGPFKIVNNYLEASGENLLFGGADPSVVNLVPGDIEIRRNHFFKPLTWRVGDPSYAGIHWVVKNLLELKNARRVLIDGNLFEHTWHDAQGGTAIVLTVRNQDGTAPWSVVEDVTFTHNIVRHAGSALHMHASDDLFPSQPTKRVLIRNNLFDDVSSLQWGGSGRLFQSLYGIEDLVIDHNTGFMDQAIMLAVPPGASAGFVYTNNLTPVGAYGFTGVDTNQGLDTLNTYFPGALFARNVLAGPWERGDPSLYPADNFFPASLVEVAFVDLAAGNYRLAVWSPYKNAGTDGKDVGADFDAIEAAFADIPLPTLDTTPPTVAVTAPSGGATVSGTITVAATASDNVGVVGVQFTLDGANLGAEVTLLPYTVAWNSASVPNGAHTLRAIARDAAGNRTTSAPVSVTVANADTTAPSVTITSPTSSSTYTTGTTPLTLGGAASDNIGVTQVTWTNSRGGSGAATGTSSWTASGIVLQLGANLLTVTAHDTAGNSATDTLTVTLTSPATFADDPLVGQSTLIKAQHIVELRAAIDSARQARGLPAFDWTDRALTPGATAVKAVHVTELRAALNQAYLAAGRAVPAYTDATVLAGQTIIRAVHLNELRSALRGL